MRPKGFLEHHRWFMRESANYLGHDEFARAKRAVWPFVRAWCGFMWYAWRDRRIQ